MIIQILHIKLIQYIPPSKLDTEFHSYISVYLIMLLAKKVIMADFMSKCSNYHLGLLKKFNFKKEAIKDTIIGLALKSNRKFT